MSPVRGAGFAATSFTSGYSILKTALRGRETETPPFGGEGDGGGKALGAAGGADFEGGEELGEVTGGEKSDPNGQRCPRCGSTDTDVDLALMEYFCLHCGYRW